MNKFIEFCQMVGLHPLVGFGMIAVDAMLFPVDGIGFVVTWPISTAIALVLTVASVLIQKNGMRESWGLALGKGLIIGIITAIPTPLPSTITFIGTGLGLVASLSDGKKSKE